MILSHLTEADLLFVADNMRDIDREEVFATRWPNPDGSDNTEALVADIMLRGSFGWIARADDGLPAAAFGAVPMWEGVWSVWMFATDEWPKVSLGVTRFIRKVMIPTLEDGGAHRAECRSLDSHHTAHRWLESLGARREHSLANYGRKGETFHTYCWTATPRSAHSPQPNTKQPCA